MRATVSWDTTTSVASLCRWSRPTKRQRDLLLCAFARAAGAAEVSDLAEASLAACERFAVKQDGPLNDEFWAMHAALETASLDQSRPMHERSVHHYLARTASIVYAYGLSNKATAAAVSAWRRTLTVSRRDGRHGIDLFCDAFRDIVLPAGVQGTLLPWGFRDVTSFQIAESVYAERSPADAPVLADALEEAGVPADERIVRHLRNEGPHYHGCWAVNEVRVAGVVDSRRVVQPSDF